MSRVYFHSPSGEAELWGGERAWLGSLCTDVALGVLRLDWHQAERIRELIKPGHYLLSPEYDGPHNFLRWKQAVETSLSVGDGTLAWNGADLDQFDLVLNTACAVGGDVMRLAARIHGQCELHCYVEGIDRAWLAQMITRGREQGVLRDLKAWRALESSWESVAKFLLDRDDEPVVLSYSVTESFPNQYVAGWEPPEDPDWMPEWYRDKPAEWAELDDGSKADYDHERWYDLPADEKWRLSMDALRGKPGGLRLDPADWNDFTFGHGLSVFDLLAPDYRDRLDSAYPRHPVTAGA